MNLMIMVWLIGLRASGYKNYILSGVRYEHRD